MQSFGNHKKYLGGTCPFIRFCWSWQSWRLIHSGLSTCFVCWQSWEYSRLVRPGVSFKRFSWSTPTEQKNKACPATYYPLLSWFVQLINSHKKYFRSKFILKWMKNTEYMKVCRSCAKGLSAREPLVASAHGPCHGMPSITQYCSALHIGCPVSGGGHYLMK